MNRRNLAYYTVLVLIVATAIILRLHIFNEVGGDHLQYKRAVLDFTTGVNPYKYTVTSFKTPGLDHGYAYPPTILYVLSGLWKLNVIFKANIATAILWKIPVLLADLGTAVLLFVIVKKRSSVAALVAMSLWLFNPYFVVRYEYTLLDPIQISLLLLALYLVKSKEKTAALFFALAVSIKIVPIILLPIFLVSAKQRLKFLVIICLTLLMVSLPFLVTAQDFYYFINGAFLLHTERGIQGRPILSLISYYLAPLHISFLQEKFPGIYSASALILGATIPYVLYRYRKVSSEFTLVSIAFGLYFLLTPVLNRTHLLWALPFFYITILTTNALSTKVRYVLLLTVYIACSLYLLFWSKGLKAPDTAHSTIWMDKALTTDFAIDIVKAPKELYNQIRYELRPKKS